MKVTDVRIYPISKKDSNLKAFASVTLDEVICITSICIVSGSKGLFISMPQSKVNDGEYHDIVFPLSAEARDILSQKIIAAYERRQGVEDTPKKGRKKSFE